MSKIKFTRREQADLEIKRLAHKYKSDCTALLQLPLKIYSQIIEDNQTRKRPYRVSFKRIQDIVYDIFGG